MQSGDKGHLDGMFNDFEYEPRPELWDRIESNSVAQEGNLAPVFAGYEYTPNSRVWRAIANQLQSNRKWKAFVWWSVAAGITLLVSLGALLRPGQRVDAVKEGKSSKWANRDDDKRSDRDLVSKVEGVRASGPQNLITDIHHDQNNHAIPCHTTPSKDVYPRQNQYSYDQFQSVAQNSLSDRDDTLASEELMQTGLASRTPDLLKMESKIEISDLSYVDFTDIKEEPTGLKTRLGSNYSPLASAGPSSSLEAGAFQSLNSGTGSLDAGSNALGNEEVFQTPVSISFALQWYLNGRWSILPGLNYSRLRSEAKGADGINGELHRYTRDYLGVMVGLQYDIIQKARYRFYATGDLQYDIGLRIKDNYKTFVDGQAILQNTITGPLGNQAGASGGLGLCYRISKRIGIYGQGTVTNYFYQSEYNLWSARPYWLNVQVGISLSL